MLKKVLSIILVYLMTIPINYLPYVNFSLLKASKYRVTVININSGNNFSFSKRMTQFIKDELETKNRIEYFKHNIQLDKKVEVKKDKTKSKRVFDESPFEDIKNIKKDIKQQKKDEEYGMLIESWQQIIDIYEENFDNLKSIQPLFIAYINKSYYENLNDMDDESKEDIKNAITIGRNLTFNPSGFSPKFVFKYKRDRKRSKKKAKGIIILKASSDHELIIDGISMGNAPVKVTNISYGKHFVLVVKSGKVVKKEVIELRKRKQESKIEIKSTKEKKKEKKVVNTPKTDSQILSDIETSLSKDEFTQKLKDNLKKFSKKINSDFIVFGNSIKKHDTYNAKIYLYNAETNTIAFLTTGEFDSDLLTGDVEGLRIGNEIVKGIDNFSSLKIIKVKKEIKNKNKKIKKLKLRTIPFIEYKKLIFPNSVTENLKNTNLVSNTQKTDNNKNYDSIDLSKVDSVKNDDKKENIDISNADYSDLDNDLNKYSDKKEKNNSAWYRKWWVWTAVSVVVLGTVGTVYLLSGNNDNTKTETIPGGTW